MELTEDIAYRIKKIGDRTQSLRHCIQQHGEQLLTLENGPKVIEGFRESLLLMGFELGQVLEDLQTIRQEQELCRS